MNPNIRMALDIFVILCLAGQGALMWYQLNRDKAREAHIRSLEFQLTAAKLEMAHERAKTPEEKAAILVVWRRLSTHYLTTGQVLDVTWDKNDNLFAEIPTKE